MAKNLRTFNINAVTKIPVHTNARYLDLFLTRTSLILELITVYNCGSICIKVPAALSILCPGASTQHWSNWMISAAALVVVAPSSSMVESGMLTLYSLYSDI